MSEWHSHEILFHVHKYNMRTFKISGHGKIIIWGEKYKNV